MFPDISIFCGVVVELSKRYADITYNLPNSSFVRIDNISDAQHQDIDADVFLSVLDAMFPSDETTNYGSHQITIANYGGWTIAGDFIQIDSRTFRYTFSPKTFEVILLPLIQQQVYLFSSSNPQYVNASFCKEGHKISISYRSLQTFTVLSGVVLFGCLGLLIYSISTRTPEVSSFAGLDMKSKIRCNNDGLCAVSSGMSDSKAPEI